MERAQAIPPSPDDTDLLLSLPDTPHDDPRRGLLAYILQHRTRFESPAIALLEQTVGSEAPPRHGFRAFYLCSLLGEWRSRQAAPILVDWLGTPWGFGGSELVTAITRVGAPAVEPLLFVLFNPEASVHARRRSARALASVGVAALDFGNDRAWRGDPAPVHAEAVAALRVVVSRARTEPEPLIEAAAEGLCHLRAEHAWPDVARLFMRGTLKEQDHFGVHRARALALGRAVDLEIGAFRGSLVGRRTRSA